MNALITRCLLAFVMTGGVVGFVSPRFAATLSDAPDGWRGGAARDEVRPEFSFNPKGGPAHTGSLVKALDFAARLAERN